MRSVAVSVVAVCIVGRVSPDSLILVPAAFALRCLDNVLYAAMQWEADRAALPVLNFILGFNSNGAAVLEHVMRVWSQTEDARRVLVKSFFRLTPTKIDRCPARAWDHFD